MFGNMTLRVDIGLSRHWRQSWRGFLWLLLVCGLNPALARDEAPGTAVGGEQGLLWQVVVPDSGKTSYLFGTIHSEDARVTKLAPEVQAAFDQSQRFVMEMVPDRDGMLAASRAMLLERGASLRALAGQRLFDKTARVLLDLGVPAQAADRMKPWAAMVVLSMPQSRTGQVLDTLLYSAAIRAGKSTSGLETAQEQLAVFDTLPQAEQLMLLEEAVAQYPQMADMLEQLHVAYLARDLAALANINEKYGMAGDAELAHKINSALIDQRNLRMAQRVDVYLRQGGVFVAVGALHLPGGQGLLQLLRRRGYTVTSIY